jgi:hypothetical protein
MNRHYLSRPCCGVALKLVAVAMPDPGLITLVFNKNATSASGSLATRASRTIFPASSTMQIVVSSNDTSKPAK